MGEFDLISQITDGAPAAPDVVLGPGDDAAVVHAEAQVCLTTDMQVEDVHFKRTWSPAPQVGRRSVAVNVADVEAMGARPTGVVVALGFPPDLDESWVLAFGDGVRAECERAGVSLLGGDLSRAPVVTVTVAALGQLDGAPVTRAGARRGHVVAVTGRLGWSGAGLTVLQRGFGSPKELVTEHQCPTVPYGQGRVAAAAGATSMMDVSDGLVSDLGHICRASGVGIDLDRSRFEIPDPVARVSAATGKSPWQFILNGGEDHALVATFPSAEAVPEDWRTVGVVTGGDAVTVDGEPFDGDPGWDHFPAAT